MDYGTVSQINPFLPPGGFCQCFITVAESRLRQLPPGQIQLCGDTQQSCPSRDTAAVPGPNVSSLGTARQWYGLSGLRVLLEKNATIRDHPGRTDGMGSLFSTVTRRRPLVAEEVSASPEPSKHFTLFMIQSASSMALLIICRILSGLSSSE